MIVFTSPKQMLLRTEDGHNVLIAEPIRLRRDDGAEFMMPVGSTSDMASTPQPVWNVLPPFGAYARATIIHDGAYRNTLLRQLEDGSWAPANLNKEQSDNLLLDCMIADGVPVVQRDMIYDGVRFGGWKAFRDDRAVSLTT